MIPFFINIKLLVRINYSFRFVSASEVAVAPWDLESHLQVSWSLHWTSRCPPHVALSTLLPGFFGVFCFSIFLFITCPIFTGLGLSLVGWLRKPCNQTCGDFNQWTDHKHGRWWIRTDEHAPCNSLSHHITCKFHYCVLWGECLLEVPFVHSFSGGLVSTSRILQDFAGGFVRFFMLDFLTNSTPRCRKNQSNSQLPMPANHMPYH